MNDIITRIKHLKKKNNAIILAHYYDEGDVQDIADHVGDSYYLAKKGQESQADVILLAGVVFMAESVKILNPTKTVLVPDKEAGCSLVDASPYKKYFNWRLEHPTGIAMTYINCSADVKSISDVICTSSNAEKIISAIPEDRPILFGPDKHLGNYLAKKYQHKLKIPMEIWNGACQVHILFSSQKLHQLTKEHPDALVLAHPECTEEILKYAHVIGSTSQLLNEVKTNCVKKFIVATEIGIFHQMQKARPDAQLIQAPAEGSCACNECPYMKLNTLKKVEAALEGLSPKVDLPQETIEKAHLPLQRMLDITEGGSTQWPSEFRPEFHAPLS